MGSSLGVPSNTKVQDYRCITQTAQGTLSFEVTGYRQLFRAFAGKFISSPSIEVGGYSWCLHYYPDGDHRKESKTFVGVYLELLTKNVEVKALYDFRLVDLTTGLPSVISQELEASLVYLRDDRLVIECDFTIVKEPFVVENMRTTSAAEALHHDLSRDFTSLLESKEEADVTFEVQGKVVAAHTIVLAARSPVSKKPIVERSHITIEDMQPAVFKALLYFIYADSLSPSMDDLDGDEKIELAKHLLVAGDRNEVQGLRSVCEIKLCESLGVLTVADMLTFADQHSCKRLKDACIEFIACNVKLDDLVATNGYDHLTSLCPDVFVDLFEKAARSRRIWFALPACSSYCG
ncbi:unnamed protein product [Urochloa decumbens]|uniref:Uncharacterized protein n=1 Tax=Urochloa decumbens TaxID=240449 RepID=A0ABC9B9Y5_9POAL